MALTRKLRKPFRSDDEAPLLQNDVLARSFEDMQSDYDVLEPAPEPSVGKQVDALKQSGRKAAAGGEALHMRRRDEALSAGKDAVKEGLFLGADALLPGLGSGLSAADSLASIRESSKKGESIGSVAAKEAITTGAGFIPVVGEVVGFCEALYNGGKAVLQGDKSRTAEKLAAAQKLKSDCARGLARVEEVREQLSDYTGKDKGKLLARLDKAERRMEKGIEMADSWLAKKSGAGSLPLLAEDESGASEAPV